MVADLVGNHVGARKAATFDWMVGRCADGSGNTAPRELIQLLNTIKDEEVRRLERGENAAPDDQLFDRAVFKRLPGVNIIPLTGNRAFLAFELGKGLGDLERAVTDRLDDPDTEGRERRAVRTLRAQVTRWRRNPALRFHTRAIIVVERLPDRRKRR